MLKTKRATQISTYYIRPLTSDMQSRSGQALLLILLAMSAALVLGVAISSRVITVLRQTSFSAQSAQSLAFAESGLEEALKCLNDQTCSAPFDPPPKDLTGDGTDDFDYVITTAGGTPVFDDLSPIERDKVVQVDLNGYPAVASVFVSWVNSASTPETDNPAAMEVSLVYLEGSEYKLSRFSYDPDSVRQAANNFLAPGSLGYDVGGVNYRYQISIAAPSTPRLLRLRALYSDIPNSFAVSASAGNNIPNQGSIIESTGFSGQVVRKVRGIYTVPAISENFDFVLFSGSETLPLNK